MMSSSKQIKLGILISYLSIGINIITGLFYTPWMIHSIGRENFGLYTLSISVISLFVFDFGLGAAVTRFISKYLAEGRQDKANECYGLVYRLYIGLDFILIIILASLYIFIPQIYQELTTEEIEKFKVVYCITSLYSVFSFPFIPLNGILIAYEKIIQLKLCELAHKFFIVGTMTVCLISGLGLYALVAVNAIAGTFAILLKILCIKKYTNQKINWLYFNKMEFKEILNFSGWITIISLAQRCIFHIAPSILGALSGSASIAILGIAITLEGYAYTFANAINGVFLPKVSRIVYQGDGNVLPLMTRIARLQIFVIGLLVLGIVCFGKDFIFLWVGESFSDSYWCTILIIIPSIFQLPQDIGLQTIYAKNKVKSLAYVFIIMAIISLIISIVLAKPLGAVGIGISVFFAYIFRTIGMDIILYRELQIDVFKLFSESFINLFSPLLVCLLIGFIIRTINPLDGWSGLFVNCTVYILTYFAIIYYMAFNAEEKKYLKTFTKRI